MARLFRHSYHCPMLKIDLIAVKMTSLHISSIQSFSIQSHFGKISFRNLLLVGLKSMYIVQVTVQRIYWMHFIMCIAHRANYDDFHNLFVYNLSPEDNQSIDRPFNRNVELHGKHGEILHETRIYLLTSERQRNEKLKNLE